METQLAWDFFGHMQKVVLKAGDGTHVCQNKLWRSRRWSSSDGCWRSPVALNTARMSWTQRTITTHPMKCHLRRRLSMFSSGHDVHRQGSYLFCFWFMTSTSTFDCVHSRYVARWHHPTKLASFMHSINLVESHVIHISFVFFLPQTLKDLLHTEMEVRPLTLCFSLFNQRDTNISHDQIKV